MYGSGAGKQASILNCSVNEAKQIIERFYEGNPGLSELNNYLKKFYKKHGYIRSINGAHLSVRSEHVLLNLLIQSSAAIIFKRWSCYIWELIDRFQWDANIIIMYHDEIEARVHKDIIEPFRDGLRSALKQTQEKYKLRVNLATDTKIGRSWGDVH